MRAVQITECGGPEVLRVREVPDPVATGGQRLPLVPGEEVVGTDEEALGGVVELLSLTSSGVLRPVVGGRCPLAEAARAQADLRSRRTTGELVLDVPG